MIVERRSYVVKEGRDQDAVAVIQKAWAALDFPNAHRIYTPHIGPFNVVVQELDPVGDCWTSSVPLESGRAEPHSDQHAAIATRRDTDRQR